MPKYISEAQVYKDFGAIGSTGSYRLAKNGDLFIKVEENSRELFCGTVYPNTDVAAIFEAVTA